MTMTNFQTDEHPTPDLDRLAGQLIDLAKQRLTELGQFYPFAAVVQADGTLAQLNYNPPGRAPLVARFIEALKESVRNGAREGQFRAAGICFLAQAACPPDKRISDAICLQLHDAGGTSMDYFLPYSRQQDQLTYAEPFRTPNHASLFPEPQE